MPFICVEIKTECKHCGGSLQLNALVDEVLCPACQKINEFPYGFWKESILESALKEYREYKEGEGQNSTMMTGEYTFQMLYGIQKPRCGKCKTSLKPELISEYAKSGKAVCEKCSNEISVRTLPDNLKQDFPGVSHLIGEDPDMFSKSEGTMKTPDDVKPILFTCPSCAGNLKIDGTDRMVTCNFCNSQIYLPDDLWFRLHPVKVVERWYIVLDEKFTSQQLVDWQYLSDVTIDKNGNLYLASAESGGDNFVVWSMSPEFKTRWRVDGLKYSYEKTGVAVSREGNVYLWDREKHSLLILSANDGTTIGTIEGSETDPSGHEPFNLKEAHSLTVDADGTIIVLKNGRIYRYSKDGQNIPAWGTEFEEPGGFLKKLFSSDSISPPDVGELKDKPLEVRTEYTYINCGPDGHLYLMDNTSSKDASIVKYDKDGNLLWCMVVPLEQKYCKPFSDTKGNVYVLGTVDVNINLVKLNHAASKWETLLKDIKEGGKLNDSDKLAVSPDGSRIYCFNNYNGMRVFDANLNMIYISSQSKEDDEESS